METTKMKIIDHATLLRLNKSSMEAGRRQNLPLAGLPAQPQDDRYFITYYDLRRNGSGPEVRMCVVWDLFLGNTVWLDVSEEEFSAIPETDVSFWDWETAMCAGTPPQAP